MAPLDPSYTKVGFNLISVQVWTGGHITSFFVGGEGVTRKHYEGHHGDVLTRAQKYTHFFSSLDVCVFFVFLRFHLEYQRGQECLCFLLSHNITSASLLLR